jgi:hypothetical protein
MAKDRMARAFGEEDDEGKREDVAGDEQEDIPVQPDTWKGTVE